MHKNQKEIISAENSIHGFMATPTEAY